MNIKPQLLRVAWLGVWRRPRPLAKWRNKYTQVSCNGLMKFPPTVSTFQF